MFSLAEIAAVLGAELDGDRTAIPSGFAVDSRRVSPGDLFFALPGARVDGHAFVDDALSRGACAAVVSRRPDPGREAGAVLRVRDVPHALQTLAGAWRARSDARFIAVTGSNGKTTTKALLAHLVGGPPRAFAAPENYNTEVGLPLALLAMPPEAEFGVFELGADRPGDIALLANLLEPSLGIVTSVGPSHLAAFGTAEAVAREKWSLIRALPSDAPAFVNADSPELCSLAAAERRPRLVAAGLLRGRVRARLVSSAPRLCIEVIDPPLHLETGLLGAHNATNLLLAALSAVELGEAPDAVEQRATSFRPVAHRMEARPARFGILIDDVYNANPASMAVALRTLAELPSASGRRIVVFGDMLELGPRSDELHVEAARLALDLGVDLVYPVGERAEAAFRAAGDRRVRFVDRAAIPADLVNALRGETDAMVLVKGSRGVHLEDVAEEILRRAPANP